MTFPKTQIVIISTPTRSFRVWVTFLVAAVLGVSGARATSIYASPPWRADTFAGYLGVGDADGPAATATFNEPSGLALGPGGEIFIADTLNSTVRALTGTGAQAVVNTIAGVPGVAGVGDGPAESALFNLPFAVAVAADGTRYVADTENHLIRKISPAGQVVTVAGLAAQAGAIDGTGSDARFRSPAGLALYPAGGTGGVLYVADTGNHLVRRLDLATGEVTTLAGTAGGAGGAGSTVNAVGTAARFHGPVALALSADGASLYVADQGGHTVRRVLTATRAVSTVAGGAGQAGEADGTGATARFDEPKGLALDGAGRLYVSEANGCRLRRITLASGAVETVAGGYRQPASVDGIGLAARFNQPAGLVFDSVNSRLIVADALNAQLRVFNPSTLAVTTLAGPPPSRGATDGVGRGARFHTPVHVARDAAGYLYVADRDNHTVRKIAPDGGVTTLAGVAGEPDTVDGTGSGARFNQPVGVAVKPDGSLIYVSEEGGHVVRRITAAGVVTTLAGQAYLPGFDNGTGPDARFYTPAGLALDAAGNVYVADFGNHSIRRITPTGVVTTFAGSPVGEVGLEDGVGTAARFWGPYGVAVGATGIVYVADSINQTIRKITPAGSVSTFAGTAPLPGAIDSSGGSSARFFYPYGVAVDAAGRVYVADYANHLIRRIEPSGAVSTLVGTANQGGAVDGIANAARVRNPRGLAVSPDGETLYVADTGNHAIRRIFPAEASEITSPLFASGTVGQTFTPYQITANRSPYLFGALGLPGGLGVDPLTGLIAGNPLQAGVFSVTLQAENIGGVGSATALFTIAKAPATITLSALEQPFDGTPRSPVATTFPEGLNVVFRYDGSGTTPTEFGVYALTAAIDDPNYQGEAVATFRIGAPVFWNVETLPGFTAPAQPAGLAFGPDGALYVADALNNTIRRRSSTGVVSTFVPASAGLLQPAGLAFDAAGNLYVADAGNHVIRRVTPAGVVSTVAGVVGSVGAFDGVGSAARFFRPVALAFAPDGALFVADSGNGSLRRITLPGGAVSTFETSQGPFDIPSSLAFATDGTLYLAAEGTHNLWQITPAGLATRIAGSGFGIPGSSDGLGSNALFQAPRALALGPDGHLYVADTFNHTLRQVTLAGQVTTVAGLAGTAGGSDGFGPSARFGGPSGLVFGPDGRLYLADTDNGSVRIAISPNGVPVFNLPGALVFTEGATPQGLAISASGSPTTYAATGLPPGLTLDPATGALGGTPTASGIYPVTLSATNALASTEITVDLTVHAHAWTTWREQVFSSAQLADSVVSDPSADPDGDGVPNLFEYLQDRDPLTRDAMPATLAVSGGRVGLVFEHLRAAPGWRLVPEYSADLLTWHRGPDYVETVSTTVLDARRQRVQVRLAPAPAALPRGFIRIKLEPSP